MSEQTATPSSHWRAEGKSDPHAGHYDGERAALTMGKLTDDELANGAFMNYDQPLNLAGIIAGTCSSLIAWMTAVKDRIRWLSRSLEKVASERDALAAELQALREQGPVAWYADDPVDGREYNGCPRLSNGQIGKPLYAHPALANELTDAAESVLAERTRQVSAEGYSPEHDDEHTDGEMVQAAADLCVHGTDFRVVDPDGDEMLGWGLAEAHRSDRRRQLVIAGALVLAEIERIDRAHNASKEKK